MALRGQAAEQVGRSAAARTRAQGPIRIQSPATAQHHWAAGVPRAGQDVLVDVLRCGFSHIGSLAQDRRLVNRLID